MHTLIERARVERARIDAAAAAEERAQRDQEQDRQIQMTREALATLFGIHPEQMDDTRGQWAGVMAEGMRFVGYVNGRAMHVRLIFPCPDCGELVTSGKIESLYSLAEVVDAIAAGRRASWGRPTWMEPGHECPARTGTPMSESAPAGLGEQLVTLIRQIAAEG